jgi:hypothetical protein
MAGFKKTTIVFRKDAKGKIKRQEFSTDEYQKIIPKKIPYANGLPSLAAGAATSREAKFRAKEYADAGLSGLHFDHNNDLVFESRQARREFCKYAGHVDRDGGYGDRT